MFDFFLKTAFLYEPAKLMKWLVIPKLLTTMLNQILFQKNDPNFLLG
jgi:hypothetical protein